MTSDRIAQARALVAAADLGSETWIVLFQGEAFGPFDSEDACYTFAARVSEEPNDWTPMQINYPEGVED